MTHLNVKNYAFPSLPNCVLLRHNFDSTKRTVIPLSVPSSSPIFHVELSAQDLVLATSHSLRPSPVIFTPLVYILGPSVWRQSSVLFSSLSGLIQCAYRASVILYSTVPMLGKRWWMQHRLWFQNLLYSWDRHLDSFQVMWSELRWWST